MHTKLPSLFSSGCLAGALVAVTLASLGTGCEGFDLASTTGDGGGTKRAQRSTSSPDREVSDASSSRGGSPTGVDSGPSQPTATTSSGFTSSSGSFVSSSAASTAFAEVSGSGDVSLDSFGLAGGVAFFLKEHDICTCVPPSALVVSVSNSGAYTCGAVVGGSVANHRANVEVVSLILNPPDENPLTVGTYSHSPDGGTALLSAELASTDESCTLTRAEATAELLTLTTLSTTRVVGSFAVTFPGGPVSGSFDLPICDLPDAGPPPDAACSR